MKKLLTVLFCVILVTGLLLTSCRREEPEPEPEPEPVPEIVEPEPEPEPEPVPEPEPEPVPEPPEVVPEPEPVPEPPEVVPEPEPIIEEVDLTREKSVDPDRPDERTGGDFYIALDQNPEVFDPHFIGTVAESNLAMALFEGLLTFDPMTGQAVPGLAESWEATEDGLVYTFHLREAEWSDGVPITAQTVVDSWLRAMRPSTRSPYASFFIAIEGAENYITGRGSADDVAIEAVDDYTFRMTLVDDIPMMAEVLPLFAFSVVPTHAIEEYGRTWTFPDNLVVNGPYTVEFIASGDFVSLVPNERYWDAENVYLDSIVYFPVSDPVEAYEMFRFGEVDWLTAMSIPQAKISEIRRRDDFHRSPFLAAELSEMIGEAMTADEARQMELLQEVTGMYKALQAGETPEFRIYNRNLIDTSVWGGWFPNMLGFHPLKDIYLK